METGYVLDFTNASFKTYIAEVTGLDIYSKKFDRSGDSKAKRLRTLWALESDSLVGKLLENMLQYEAAISTDQSPERSELRHRCARIVGRLLGKELPVEIKPKSDIDFLAEDFSRVRLADIALESAVFEVMERRLVEAKACFDNGAYLSAIIMCGSILEGLLLGCAQACPSDFNQSECAPKAQDGKTKRFPDWTLANFIDVATDIRKLSPDVKKFGHALREFRNYVHPYQQLASRFTPDEHTAKISLQVLLAAIADLSGKRKSL